MKIGIDIHGVIDDNPEFFKAMCAAMIKDGHEVHVITGPPKDKAIEDLLKVGFKAITHYTHFFSIVDYHTEKGTILRQDEKGDIFMDDYTWDKTKAGYCIHNKIDMHFDDSDVYSYFFKTPYARIYTKNKRKRYIQQGDLK